MISLSPNFSVLVSPRSNRPPWKFFVCDCVLFFFLCSLREAGNLVLCGMNSNKKDERNFSLEPNYMFRIIVSWILFSITILLCAVYFCRVKDPTLLFSFSLSFILLLFYFTFLFLFFSKWIIEPSIRKNDERNDEFSCLRKRLMQLILLRWFFFLFIYLFLTFTDDYFSSALFSARFSTSLYSSPIFFCYGQCHIFTIYRINGAWHVRIFRINLTNVFFFFYFSLTR